MHAYTSDTEFSYEIGYSYDDVVLPEHEIHQGYSGVSYLSWYIRSGSLQLKANETTYSAGPGDWIFIDPLTTKSHRFSPGTHLISIRFRLTWQNLQFIPPLNRPLIYKDTKQGHLLRAAETFCAFEATHKGAIRTAAPSTKARRKSLFYEWLHQWHQVRENNGGTQPLPMDKRIYEMISVLGENTSIATVDYPRLSQTVGLSRAQIDRVFKEATDLTPKQWCEAHCIKAAEDWLKAGELSVKEIAAELGFFDASHFTKWFRTKMGVTPTAWREM